MCMMNVKKFAQKEMRVTPINSHKFTHSLSHCNKFAFVHMYVRVYVWYMHAYSLLLKMRYNIRMLKILLFFLIFLTCIVHN